MPPNKNTSSHDRLNGAGFEDAAGATFEVATGDDASPDAIRFAQTVALTRMFNLIEAPVDREQVIAFARSLAGTRPD